MPFRLLIVMILTVFLTACTGESGPPGGRVSNSLDPVNTQITVYKTPYCGCCKTYIDYLKDNGFSVKTVDTEAVGPVKLKYNIPREMESCHTAVVGDYFIEGHVPVNDVIKLLEEKPRIDGIALPGMPSGSPGMGGSKSKPFVIYGLSGGKPSIFSER